MISPKLPKIWYGGDYNPDQWPEKLWPEDMRLMKLAHIDVATLPIFSWTKLQPAQDRYDFEWLDRILDLMAENGVYACLATSTAAQPAWLSQQFPTVLRTDINGVRRKYGGRVNFCPSSPIYRQYSVALTTRLAERYQDHPTLVAWHIGNEYGQYCYCDQCAAGFRQWLRRRYGSLDRLNEVWNTAFWSHGITAWEEVETPTLNGERGNHPMVLDYDRFQSDATLACYRGEYDAIKAITPDVMVTTNFMADFKPLNYQAWAPYLDVISWDSYPDPDELMSDVAFKHEIQRGLRDGQPFMLMEQTPSTQNWKPRNKLKRPGVMRLQSYQAVAHGADSVMFFQFRRARGGPEKMHGAVVDHVGHEHTRVFREVSRLGQELESLGEQLIDSRQHANVALLFDWENWWAIDYCQGPTIDLDYVRTVKDYYRAFWCKNIPVDVVNPDADLSGYDLVVAPVLYMLRPGVAENLRAHVHQGGHLLTTYLSGIVDENDLVTLGGYPGELRELLGIWAEEIDALLQGEMRRIVAIESQSHLQGEYSASILCDLVHLEGAHALAVYDEDFYKGRPALTVNVYGKGRAYYVAAQIGQKMLDDLVAQLAAEMGIAAVLTTPTDVEVTQRCLRDSVYTFMLNHNAVTVEVVLPCQCNDVLTGDVLTELATLEPYGVRILTGIPLA